jgi:Cu/Ag efflux pump CusA
MQAVISSILRLRTFIVALAAVLLVASFWQLRNVPLDVVPEFSPVHLVVKTEALGLSAAEVESLITVPIEADLLNGVPWLENIESESTTGLSSIEMTFEPGTDYMRARQMVQERLTQAHALPNVSSPPIMLQPISSTSHMMNVGLSSKTVSLVEMSVMARWTIAPRLLGVPGVANVAIWGQRDRQLQVLVDPARLAAKGVTLHQVVKTAGEAVWASPLTYLNSSTPGTGGFVETPNQRLNVRHLAPITTAADFRKVPVHGTNVALGDTASVVEGHQPLIGDALLPDGDGLLLIIDKFPGFNTQDVTRRVEAAMAELAPGMEGIKIETDLYRPASFLERATKQLTTALIISGILLIAGLALLLGNWRSALVAAVATGVTLMATVSVVTLMGLSLNMMLIAGLMVAIGAIVHEAVAVIDTATIQQRLEEAGAPRSSGARRGLLRRPWPRPASR